MIEQLGSPLDGKPHVGLKKMYLIRMDDVLLAKTMTRLAKMEGTLTSTLIPRMLPLLDGRHTKDEITEALVDTDKAVVSEILDKLDNAGLLNWTQDTAEEISDDELELYESQLAFFSEFADPRETQRRLKNSSVLIVGLEELGVQVLLGLAAMGVGHLAGTQFAGDRMHERREDDESASTRLAERVSNMNPHVKFVVKDSAIDSVADLSAAARNVDLVVACAEKPNPTLFETVNTACLSMSVPWTCCQISDTEALIGPSIIPHQTPCYRCYEKRTFGTLQHYEEHLAILEHLKKNPTDLKFGRLPCFESIVAGLTCSEAVRLLTDVVEPATIGKVLVLDLLSMNLASHKVLKLPRCDACGRPSKQEPTMRLWSEE